MPTAAPANQDVRVVPADAFTDDLFAPLDTRTGPDHLMSQLSDIADENPEFAPTPEEVVATTPTPQAIEPTPVPTPSAPEPEVMDLGDGSSVTITKDSKGWSATLTIGGGAGKEVFRGRTKDEMWQQVAAGKINATKKIRQLNRKVKLGGESAKPAVAPQTEPVARQLSADEKFQIKTELAADPDKAMESWFQKKFGLTAEQLVKTAKDAERAAKNAEITLRGETVARDFLAEHPDYYVCNENYFAIVAYMAKHKLRKVADESNFDAIVHELGESGNWTLENMNEAYEELSEDGLLEVAPEEEETEIPAPVPTPAPAPVQTSTPSPSDPRIVSRTRQLRAGYGIPSRTATAAPPADSKPQPAEDLDNLSDAEINQLLTGVRQHVVRSGRR